MRESGLSRGRSRPAHLHIITTSAPWAYLHSWSQYCLWWFGLLPVSSSLFVLETFYTFFVKAGHSIFLTSTVLGHCLPAARFVSSSSVSLPAFWVSESIETFKNSPFPHRIGLNCLVTIVSGRSDPFLVLQQATCRIALNYVALPYTRPNVDRLYACLCLPCRWTVYQAPLPQLHFTSLHSTFSALLLSLSRGN